MKAILKPVKAWIPHKDKDIEETHKFGTPGTMAIYVGSVFVGNVVPITTEPEELFKLHSSRLLIEIDINDTLAKARWSTMNKQKGKPLQEILDTVELVFKDFLNKICK